MRSQSRVFAKPWFSVPKYKIRDNLLTKKRSVDK